MLTAERERVIENWATKIDNFSEKYQLSHAIVAIERLYKDKVQEDCAKLFNELRESIMNSEGDSLADYRKQAMDLQKESTKRIHILIEYSDQIEANSSRTTRTKNDTFLISLPRSMANIRQTDGKIDFNLYTNLRKLMAHELGHVVLHSGFFDSTSSSKTKEEEEYEATFFAEKLLALRGKHKLEMDEAADIAS